MHQVREWLYIGDANHARYAGEENSIQSIISLTTYKIETVDYTQPYNHHISMRDSHKNSQKSLNNAVEKTLQLKEKHDEVLVHCAVGVSRSATIVATVLAIEENLQFEEALQEVEKAKSNVNPNYSLREQAKTYLNR